jgi:hypothetical protein
LEGVKWAAILDPKPWGYVGVFRECCEVEACGSEVIALPCCSRMGLDPAVVTDDLLSLASLGTEGVSECVDFFRERPINGILVDLFFEGEDEDEESPLSTNTTLLPVLLGPDEEPRKKSVKSDVLNCSRLEGVVPDIQ